MILVLVVSLYTTRVVLQALGVVDYGINNVVGGFVSMFGFLNTSMSNGTQRFYNYKKGTEGEDSLTKVYTVSLLIQLLLSVIVVLLLETVGLWYLNEKMVIPEDRMATAQWLYQLSVLSLVFVIMQIPYTATIMAYERMNFYAYISIIEVVLKLLFALWLPYVSSDKLLVYGIYHIVIVVLTFLLNFFYCKRYFKPIKLQKELDKGLLKKMLSFSGWNIFGTFAYMLKNQGLNILLNAFFGPIVNAARGISAMIGGAIQGFQLNIVVSFRPQVVQSYAEGNISRVKNLMYSLSKISYLMLFLLSMPIIIELPYILNLWLGNVVPDYTISFTILILVVMLLSSLNTPLSQVVHASGKMKNYQIGTSIVICSILPVAWIVLKHGGNPTSVYFVSIAMTVLNQIVCMMLLKKIFPYSIHEYIKQVLFPCIIITITAPIIPVILHCIFPSSFIRLVIIGVFGVGCTLLISYLCVLNIYEKDMVNEFVRKILKK
jgi:O-antigen/teichoic acid export membrane protein